MDFPGIDAAGGFDGVDFGARPDQVFGSNIQLDAKQYSLFGEASLDLTDRLAVTVGGRYFSVKQNSDTLFFGVLAATPGISESFKFKEDGFNPKINLSYKLSDDQLVYAQAAKGFRLGGTNQPVPQAPCGAELAALGFDQPPPSFASDTLWNYEVGAKTSLAGGRITANAALYYIDWKKPPLAVDLQCGFSTLINAGQFKIYGAELDLEARPAEGVVLRAGAAYNHGELSGALPVLGGIDGDRVPQTPKWTFNASADYDFPLAIGGDGTRGFVHVDYRFVGNRVTNFPGSPNYSGYFRLPSYNLVGFRAGATLGGVTLEAFLDNAFDERAVLNETRFVRAYDENPGTAIYTNRPRTGGIKASVAF